MAILKQWVSDIHTVRNTVNPDINWPKQLRTDHEQLFMHPDCVAFFSLAVSHSHLKVRSHTGSALGASRRGEKRKRGRRGASLPSLQVFGPGELPKDWRGVDPRTCMRAGPAPNGVAKGPVRISGIQYGRQKSADSDASDCPRKDNQQQKR